MSSTWEELIATISLYSYYIYKVPNKYCAGLFFNSKPYEEPRAPASLSAQQVALTLFVEDPEITQGDQRAQKCGWVLFWVGCFVSCLFADTATGLEK